LEMYIWLNNSSAVEALVKKVFLKTKRRPEWLDAS
jgi:hypothetical protein